MIQVQNINLDSIPLVLKAYNANIAKNMIMVSLPKYNENLIVSGEIIISMAVIFEAVLLSQILNHKNALTIIII